jgi:transposase-like protein
MNCPDCQSEQILKNGKARLQDRRSLQKYVCKVCGKQFNERTGTPMSRLRSTPESLSLLTWQWKRRHNGIRGIRRLIWIPLMLDT